MVRDATPRYVPGVIVYTRKITKGGRVTIPAPIRRRWNVRTLESEDHGDYVIFRPVFEETGEGVTSRRYSR